MEIFDILKMEDSKILKKLENAIEQVAKIEQVPKLEGKHMIMVVAPR